MKKAVLSVALAVAGWAAAAQAGEANLIVNADFKTDGLGGLLNWEFNRGHKHKGQSILIQHC